MSITLDPIPSNFNFMIQTSATYVTGEQLALVFSLLAEHVDPISIPEYVRQRVRGVALDVEDVEAIRDGHFHISASREYMKMMSSGNLITIDLVDDFFILLPTMRSLHHMRSFIEKEYDFVINDDDLLDLYDNSFTMAGSEAANITTKSKAFLPARFGSELFWLWGRRCSGEFLSQYMWYKFHLQILPDEVEEIGSNHLERLQAAFLESLRTDRFPPSAFEPPCLKQTPCRRQPPSPIITTAPPPSEELGQAEQLQGATYTANPFVLSHNDDGSYTTMSDFVSEAAATGGAVVYDSEPSLSHLLGEDLYRLIWSKPDSSDGSVSWCDCDLDMVESGDSDYDSDLEVIEPGSYDCECQAKLNMAEYGVGHDEFEFECESDPDMIESGRYYCGCDAKSDMVQPDVSDYDSDRDMIQSWRDACARKCDCDSDSVPSDPSVSLIDTREVTRNSVDLDRPLPQCPPYFAPGPRKPDPEFSATEFIIDTNMDDDDSDSDCDYDGDNGLTLQERMATRQPSHAELLYQAYYANFKRIHYGSSLEVQTRTAIDPTLNEATCCQSPIFIGLDQLANCAGLDDELGLEMGEEDTLAGQPPHKKRRMSPGGGGCGGQVQ